MSRVAVSYPHWGVGVLALVVNRQGGAVREVWVMRGGPAEVLLRCCMKVSWLSRILFCC